MSTRLEYALVGDMSWQDSAQWQIPDTPFMSFAFWQALTDTGAIGEPAGWLPIFVLVYRSNKAKSTVAGSLDIDSLNINSLDINSTNINDKALMQPVAVMPVFVKGHHRGEFVFDYAWAEAYARYGLDYYPRLVTSSPYTPITGQRIWLTVGQTLDSETIQTIMAGVDDIAQQVGASSWHGLFVTPELATLAASTKSEIAKALADNHSASQHKGSSDNDSIDKDSAFTTPILERQGCQFLWQNKDLLNDKQPFADFDGFIMTLTAKKRKTIRAERRKVATQGIECLRKCGDTITEADWQAFYHCYVMTYVVRGQQPYLTEAFFKLLAATMSEHIMLAQALDATGEIIASSLFLYDKADSDGATLYGRYWGALGEYDSLHFELCYYQGIEFAIEQGLIYFDPGTQGEHKLIRGFIPTTTHSLHRIYDARFIPAIANFCVEDRQRMAQYRQQAYEALPFNQDNMPTFDSDA